ncbi:MAG TPA: glycoside hydrolase family 38 C-terminal domain-containing protein [Bryobacteraceae bacterium]|jgi:alpha-mannosidase|nr:glycoside hydrolase family 38 C-terminal domain-containing protein [Bryobacteraceae bacterium]
MRRLFLPLLFALILEGADVPDLKKTPTLYVVGYAHLDTEWNWDYTTTIGQYLPRTMLDNFALFEKYPHYIFNFTGANRYRMMKEYYPQDYAKVKRYVDSGRWYPAGSSMEEGDVNAPSAEAILREILYGNKWFQHEFGKSSAEYMLPDCFGFPASLPSILAHAGIKGFSTQKLSANWQPAPHVGGPDSPEKTPEGIPFNVGLWIGPDGKSVIAALNPLSYGSNVTYDLTKTPPPVNPIIGGRGGRGGPPEDWPKRVQIDGDATGVFADYHYVGTGDVGGSPQPDSVRVMEDIITKSIDAPPQPRFGGRGGAPPPPPAPSGPPMQYGDGSLKVEWSNADQLFKDMIACCSLDRLPTYKGDLELINHSAGSLTSQTIHKRWNRKNELLADAAEKASVAAAWLGARPYPQQRLNNAWTLVMGGHFHDIMAGTATPKAYEYSWNDDVIAMNQFANILSDATEAVSSALNTQTKGVPVIVYNPLSIAREDIVEAEVSFPGGMPKAIRVTGPDGKDVASQISNGKVIFVATAPSAGYAVYDVQPAESAMHSESLTVHVAAMGTTLLNSRYSVSSNQAGDITSIFDNSLKKELLSAPIRLALQYEKPVQWPAWNMDWEDQKKPPRGFVSGTPAMHLVEDGAARISLVIARETEGSKFIQTIRLSAGDAGNRVEILNSIDWKIGETALKATFPLTASNPEATYNWDIGTIKRGNNEERKFEVASHQWIDLTDKSGQFGTTILTDCKNGSDKPDDQTLRLTLIYSPGVRMQYTYQASNDWGHHEFIYGIAGHPGKEPADWQAERLNQPLIAFEASKHTGPLGKTFSLLNVNNPRIRVLALKKAESSDELILRAVEMDGNNAQNVKFSFAGPIASAREVNGQEEPLGAATVAGGALTTNFTPFQPRTFAIKLAASPTELAAPKSQSVALKYDFATATTDGTKSPNAFNLPAEMLPASIDYDGIKFQLAAGPNAVVAKGQSIPLPGKFNRVYILAASADGDQSATFKLGDRSETLNIQDWGGYIGQWDNRTWKPKTTVMSAIQGLANQPPRIREEPFGELTGITPGFIKRADLAWYASHHHNADGTNALYSYAYLFAYSMDAAGAKTLTLPNNDKIRILAVTVADEPSSAKPAEPLYDTLRK